MNLKTIAAAAALCLASTGVFATPVTWTLDPVPEAHGFNVWGTFTFDADTGTYTDAQFHFAISSATFGVNSGNANTLNFGIANNTGIVTLDFNSPLTNAGGTIEARMTSYAFGNPAYTTATVHAPSQTPAVPEPQNAAMIAAALGLIAFTAAKRKSV